jgi:signal transduction histidine kinase
MSGNCQDCRFGARRHYTRAMSRRPLVIVLMLLTCLVLIGVLGWQSWRLQQSNDAVAKSVQRDYANLAADEYGRRITAALGYRGYFQIISRVDNAADAHAIRGVLQNDAQLADAVGLVDGIFVVSNNELSLDGLQLTEEMRQVFATMLAARGEIDGPYKSTAASPGIPRVVYASAGKDNDARVYGFTVAANGVAAYLRAALDAGPLLPESLGNGKVGNDQLFVAVSDANGDTLLVSNSVFAYSQIVEKIMGDDYQGVVEGYRIRIAVNPSSAGALVIGGLPAEQLPLLVLVMLLAVALLLTAIWLFRREHAVMKMRVDFVSQVSHELRTPLTQIRMFAETLLLKRTRSEEEQQRSLQIIDRESRRLSHLVENILLFSSISDSLKVDPELQPVAPIVREVCEATSLATPDLNIEVMAEDSVAAIVDDDALRQILLNLLDNAIKYGPQGQQVTVSVSQGDCVARIEVVDQGPGIQESERDRVWGAFYRLGKEQQTAISGTGIGLAVVRGLVEAMHGRCWIADSESGARIVVEIPGSSDDD